MYKVAFQLFDRFPAYLKYCPHLLIIFKAAFVIHGGALSAMGSGRVAVKAHSTLADLDLLQICIGPPTIGTDRKR